MHEIERISRRISDRLWELSEWDHAWHWEIIADVFLSLMIPMDEVVKIARKIENTPCIGELKTFSKSIQNFYEDQE